jgi:hypothetical protein
MKQQRNNRKTSANSFSSAVCEESKQESLKIVPRIRVGNWREMAPAWKSEEQD